MLFAGTILGIAGIMRIFDGIWAFRYDGDVPDELESALLGTSLSTYGWVWIIVGVVLILSSFAVLNRSQFARWIGIIAGSVAGHHLDLVDAVLPGVVARLHHHRRVRRVRPRRPRRPQPCLPLNPHAHCRFGGAGSCPGRHLPSDDRAVCVRCRRHHRALTLVPQALQAGFAAATTRSASRRLRSSKWRRSRWPRASTSTSSLGKSAGRRTHEWAHSRQADCTSSRGRRRVRVRRSPAVRLLGHMPVQVTLIDRRNHHLFQPLLYQVATGMLSPGQIAPPIRHVVRRCRNVQVVLAEVTDFDLDNRIVHTSSPADLEQLEFPYDSLIVAAGVNQSYFGHDEFARYAPGMKTIDDALELRRRIFGAFEMAEVLTEPASREKWPTVVIVGAGPTGVELAGQVRELATRSLRQASSAPSIRRRSEWC